MLFCLRFSLHIAIKFIFEFTLYYPFSMIDLTLKIIDIFTNYKYHPYESFTLLKQYKEIRFLFPFSRILYTFPVKFSSFLYFTTIAFYLSKYSANLCTIF